MHFHKTDLDFSDTSKSHSEPVEEWLLRPRRYENRSKSSFDGTQDDFELVMPGAVRIIAGPINQG